MAKIIGGIADDYGAELQFDDGTRRYLMGEEAKSLVPQMQAEADTGVPMVQYPGGRIAPDITEPAYWRQKPGPSANRLAGPMMSAEPDNMSVAPPPAPPEPEPQGPMASFDSSGDSPNLGYSQAGAAAAMQAYQEARRGRAVTTPAYDPVADDASRSPVRQSAVTATSGAVPYSEDVQGGPDRVAGMRLGALGQALEGQRAGDRDAANLALDREAMYRQQVADDMARQREIQSRFEDRKWQLDRLEQEIGSGKIEPNRVMKGPAGVFAAIAVGFGEIGRVLAGSGSNSALQIVQSAIDRDVAAQEKEFALKQHRANNMFSQFMREYGDKDIARDALRASQLKYAQAQLDSLAARNKVAQGDPAFMQAAADIEADRLRTKAALEEKLYGQVTNQVNSAFLAPRAASVQYVGSKSAAEAAEGAAKVADLFDNLSGAGTSAQRAQMAKDRAKAGVELGKEGRERIIYAGSSDTPVGYAIGDQANVNKVREAIRFGENIDSKLTEAIKILRENPVESRIPSSPEYAKLQSLQLESMLDYKGPAGAQLGVLAGPDMAILQGIIPGPNGIYRADKLEAFRNRLRESTNAFVHNNVVRPDGSRAGKPRVQGAKEIK